MITLKKIQLNNFLSHSKTTIEFKPEQKLLLDGNSGSGKSSIVEGLLWALFGKGRADNRSLIKRGAKKSSVVVELLEDDKTYTVIRSIDEKNNHSLEVTENNSPIKVKGIRETQEYLEKNILHSSYILFINSIVYPQENTDNFVKQTAAKRKDLILEIINASDYDDYLKKTKDHIQLIRSEQEVTNAKIENKNNDIKNNQETANKLPEYEKEEARLKQEIDALKKQYEDHTQELKKIENNIVAIGNKQILMEGKLKEYNAKGELLLKLNAEIIEWSGINIKQIQQEIEALNQKKKKLDEYNEAKSKLIEWQTKNMTLLGNKPEYHDYPADIDYATKQLNTLAQDATGKCPKCGYLDPQREEQRQNGIIDLEAKISSYKAQFEAQTKALVDYSTQKDALGAQPELPLSNEEYAQCVKDVASIDELNKKLINAESYQVRIKDNIKSIEATKAEQQTIADEVKKLEEEIGNNNNLLDKERETKDAIIKINGKIDELMMAHTNNNVLLGGAKYAVKMIEQSKKEVETLKESLSKNNESYESLNLLKDAFGQNGIKAIVIDYVIPQLEERVNNILGKLSNFKVKLETQKSGIGDDVTLEGLFITVVNEVGEEFNYDQFSGGEKVKISVAINEALAEFSKVGFRVLDETIVALDNESIENFLVAMEEILSKVKQVVCISHITEIKEMFEEKLTITKTNGDSRINV